MKFISAAWLLALPVFGQTETATFTPVSRADNHETAPPFDKPQPPLSEKERDSLLLAKKWIENPQKPRLTQDGKVTYLYGATLPTVFAIPLHNTDIELEPGEKVREGGISLGDTARWLAVPAVSGPDEALVTHVLLKPKDVGLTTTLVLATDRRTYHFLLKSTDADWTPRLGFEYSENIERAWANYQKQVTATTAARTMPATQQDMALLDFGYQLKGEAPWKPLRVYNDGIKTFIQMPKAMKQTEAPALLVLGTDKKEQLVNYRLVEDRYIVDQIFQQAELVAGVGPKQTKIVIRRGAAQ